MFKARPKQQEILAYTNGKMGVSAVPGSGKTSTLSYLAAKMVATVDLDEGQEILIVTHRQSPVQNLTIEQARALFAGQGDPSVQVWVYASGEDVQEMFDRVVMEGSTVSPAARLAVHPQHMSDTLVNEANTVGILPRHWKAGDVREVFRVGTVPVLAITDSEPQGVIRELIACLQK